VAYTVFRQEELAFQPPRAGDQDRRLAGLSDAMTHMRANVWRYPSGTRGRRHADRVQEEVFVVLEGSPSMLLGDPPERVELTPGSIVVVQPGTPLQLRNDSGGDAVLFVVGAPPETGQADFFPEP
jgi:mannose-6-phosphate isomerase-like protein (cupin superfamily)